MSQDDSDLRQRVRYMERLLRHYVGDISLDLENLRGLADAVTKEPSAQRERSGSQGSDYVGTIEEESFTVQPLGNNTTREFYPSCNSRKRLSSRICRLLGRVLTLELFHADQAVDRAMRP